MAGNDDDQDAAATNDEDEDADASEPVRRAANARYLYVKHRLPGETYEAFRKRLSDEAADTEHTRCDDGSERE